MRDQNAKPWYQRDNYPHGSTKYWIWSEFKEEADKIMGELIESQKQLTRSMSSQVDTARDLREMTGLLVHIFEEIRKTEEIRRKDKSSFIPFFCFLILALLTGLMLVDKRK